MPFATGVDGRGAMQVGLVLAVSAAGMALAAALAWLVMQAVLRLTFGRWS